MKHLKKAIEALSGTAIDWDQTDNMILQQLEQKYSEMQTDKGRIRMRSAIDTLKRGNKATAEFYVEQADEIESLQE